MGFSPARVAGRGAAALVKAQLGGRGAEGPL